MRVKTTQNVELSLKVINASGLEVSDAIDFKTDNEVSGVIFGAFKGDIEQGHTYSVDINGSKFEYTASGNEVSFRDVIDSLVEKAGETDGFSFSTVSGLVSDRASNAVEALDEINNLSDQIEILENSLELANKSALNTASGTSSVDGLLILKSIDGAVKHELTVTVGEDGNEKDNLIEIIVGGGDSIFSAFRISGAVEAGDEYKITINEQEIIYTATGSEADINEVRDGVLSVINSNVIASSSVLAIAGVGAAGQVNDLALIADQIFSNSNLSSKLATSSASEVLEANFASDLQSAEELSEALAQKAEFDAKLASQKAAAAAQAVADQQAADRLAEQLSAAKLASELAEQAADQASDDDASTLDALQARNQAEVALDNLDAAAAAAFADAAELASDIAQATADAAAQAARGKGLDAINEATKAAASSLSARISASEARAFAELAAQNATAVEDWVSGAASINREGAAQAASEAAATAASASTAAKTAIANADALIAATVAPNVALASAKAIVASRILSLEEVSSQRALADDGDDDVTNAIEAVWDASIKKAGSALSTAQDALKAAQSAADAANEAASIAQASADAALTTAQNASAVAAQAAAAASFAATLKLSTRFSAAKSG